MKTSSYLLNLGFEMRIHGDKLRVVPREKITPEIREYIRSNKAVLMEEVKKRQSDALGECHESGPEGKDPFLVSGAACKVFLPPLERDVWLCPDEKARSMVKDDGLPCLLFTDLVYILRGKPGEDRLSRLKRACAKRNPVTEEVLRQLNGKVTSVKTVKEYGNE